jgi:4-diphosphocytidyl-2-C-methyl-D-erythritol kinase
VLTEQARAKVNLTLRVLGRRPDGYHDLGSVVVFADVGDRLQLTPGPELSLSVRGRTAAAAGADADNLVLKAARVLAAQIPGLRTGAFELEKELPVAAGLGGGSADAAAALRLLVQLNGLSLEDPRVQAAAKATGADVPVCLTSRPRIMRGIGDVLSDPLTIAPLPAVLINPGVAVPTKDVFARLRLTHAREAAHLPEPPDALLAAVQNEPNDLESPACALQPVIADVLTAIRDSAGCKLARMSGSGATCFGIFDTPRLAEAAAGKLAGAHSKWWVCATTLR